MVGAGDEGEGRVIRDSKGVLHVCAPVAMFALCEGVKLVILRFLHLHAFLEVLYRVHDTPVFRHGVMRVFRHEGMVTHHKPHLLHSFLGEFAGPLAREAACREPIGASCVDTCVLDIDLIRSG